MLLLGLLGLLVALLVPAQSGGRCRCSGEQRYRPIDGSCNNLRHPSLGKANTPLLRLLRPEYGNISDQNNLPGPRLSRSGNPLPSAQDIVVRLFPQVDRESPTSHLFVIWGQLLSHDFARIEAPVNQAVGPCCEANAGDNCIPISVSRNDPFYRQFDVTCLPLTRTNTTRCKGRPEQLSGVTHYLDASFIYGSSRTRTRRLRQLDGGRLRVRHLDDGEFLPTLDTPACTGSTTCYEAGDDRVSQNPMVAALQILWAREHNRIAGVLADLNPHWEDERLFQETRRIVVAEWQHITYDRWLRWLLGKDAVRKLRPNGASPSSGYFPDVDPRTANDVTTGGYRSLHSMVQGKFWVGSTGRYLETIGRWFNNPVPVLEKEHGLLDTLQGLVRQQAQDQDRWFDNEITQQYEPITTRDGRQWGNDLTAIDIQRGREHWLASYNRYREYVGLRRAESFQDLQDTISKEDVAALRDVYEHVDDVDYYVGGLMERRKEGAFLFGPSFQGPLEDQFWRWRFGDRFFYNFVGFRHSLETDQIRAIQSASGSRLLCDNVRGFQTVPRDPFIEIGFHGNEDVPCESLPEVDLSCWREHHDGKMYGCQRSEPNDRPLVQNDWESEQNDWPSGEND